MTSFKGLFAILFIVTSLGCVKADQVPSETSEKVFVRNQSLIPFNNNAMFEAGDIQLEDIKFSHAGNAEWKEVNQIQLFLKLCGIRDRASQGTIRNEKFNISSELGENIVVTRDNETRVQVGNPITVNSGNCLRWSQFVPKFDYLAPSLNIALHYEIVSLSGGMGKLVKRIGFNPWDMYRSQSKTKGFFDLTDFARENWHSGQWVFGEQEVVRALNGTLLDSTSRLAFKSISIEPIEREQQRVAEYNQSLQNLNAEERKTREEIDKMLLTQKQGLHINVNMAGVPFVRVEDSTGLLHPVDITSGRFKVYMNLVASGATDDDRKFLLSSNVSEISKRSSSFSWKMDEDSGQLLASVPLLLKNRTEFGNIEMLIKVEPVSPGLRNIRPYTAVLHLGQYNNWFKRQTAPIKFDENYQAMTAIDYERYVESVDGISKNISTIREQDRFYFGPLKARFVRIMPGESATDRTLQYSVSTCVEHGLYGTSVGRGLQFDIVTEDKVRGLHKMRRQTNEDGCLTWFGFLSHKYYRREVLQKKVASVQFAGTADQTSQYSGMINKYDKEFTYYMNPWDEKWTFGWDEPDMPRDYPAEIEKQRKTAPKSQLFIADFKYTTIGFRYAIDKYLNLKVKKAVLLQAYPYVLKYNSIVLGRNGTEKLRDGVYLMKVALQKDYLDPAAKGVRIYDEKTNEPIHLADKDDLDNFVVKPEFQEREYTEEELKNLKFRETFPDAFDHYDQLVNGGARTIPGMSYSSTGETSDEKDVDYKLLSSQELKEAEKEFISVQTKLVRVMGGMIITPIEFEVDDLRLMRIRNQFFIQLETIDEHRLRYASVIDRALDDMYEEGEIEQRYKQIFDELDHIEDIESDIVQTKLNSMHDELTKAKVEAELAELRTSLEESNRKIEAMLGLNQFEKGSSEYATRLKDIQAKIDRLNQYRKAINGKDGISEQAAFRNDKRLVINRIMQEFEKSNKENQEVGKALVLDTDNQLAEEKDPILKFFYMGTSENSPYGLQTVIDYKLEQAKKQAAIAREEGDELRAAELETMEIDLETLKIADFTESPLTPSFSFEMLSNEGIHEPRADGTDDGKSGLPQRTFVGPLTFVFNTNGSTLRPTNILNEAYCKDAFCSQPEVLRQKIEQGVPPTDIEGVIDHSANGEIPLTAQPIYNSGDSVNANYENNKYYGYLKAYHGITVDDLIVKKKKIEENYQRKMEEASQIINFTKTMGLKYVLLNDNPKSRLKSIDHACAQKIDLNRIGECFSDVTSGDDVLDANTFWNQLNRRQLGTKDVDANELHAARLIENNYNLIDQEITEHELTTIMRHGWQDPKVNPTVSRQVMHRMCFVLTQNLLKEEFYTEGEERVKHLPASAKEDYKQRRANYALGTIEKLCHEYVGNVYGYNYKFEPQKEDGTPVEIAYSPVVLERKLRAYDTTNRYVYRGGKSLNINLSASFNLSSSNGIKISTGATYKPWDWVKDLTGKIPVVGPALKFIAGGFGISRTNSRDESAGRTQGTNVSSGTFLVSQQATFDIELGEYERCLVARFHPAFMRKVIDTLDKFESELFFGRGEENGGFKEEQIAAQGLLICSGKRENECLPIKEKYYYFTQHFTEGDMLDTADLHNHPWLLQLRGYRDFQVFTSMLGAREVGYIDNNKWLKDVMSRTLTDAAALSSGMNGSHEENQSPELQIVDQESDMNWPLEELSRTYFEVLPTFPGLYTYISEDDQDVKREWPYKSTDPGRSFTQCEQ